MKNIFRKLAFILVAMSLVCISSFAASPGSLDQSFGIGGKVANQIFGTDVPRDIEVMDNGKIVTVGSNGTGDFVTARYNSNGTLDTTFSGDGIVFTDFTGGFETATGVAIQPDGKIIVVGTSSVNPNTMCIVRFNENGSFDTTFDIDGKVTFTVGSGVRGDDVKIQPDGKILIIGASNPSTGFTFAAVRLNLNGSLDTTFDTDGIVVTVLTGTGFASAGEILPDGKIVIAGAVGSNLNVVRYNSNGSLDTTFSGDGIATFDISTTLELWGDLAVKPDGRIMIAGRIGDFGGIVQLTNSGALDVNFAGDGSYEFTAFNTTTTGIKLQSDGKIVVCGETRGSTTNSKTFVARLIANGTLDPTFGNAGITITDQNGSLVQSIEIVGDKLLVSLAANFLNGSQDADFALQRYSLSATPTQESDFDGDAFTDSAVYRPSTGNWFILNSATNTVTIDQFGANGDLPIGGDFDGDGKSDVSIYRPSNGEWYFKRSSDSTVFGAAFGGAGDKPIAGDYDKDGKTDIAFFRPGNGNWFVLRSSTNFTTFFAYPFGQAGDIPIPISGS
jgi:uncharacterized delta-60 repeat protein